MLHSSTTIFTYQYNFFLNADFTQLVSVLAGPRGVIVHGKCPLKKSLWESVGVAFILSQNEYDGSSFVAGGGGGESDGPLKHLPLALSNLRSKAGS